MRVLKLEREPGEKRTGVFTSGIVATAQSWKIALYFTGRQHAGENLAEVLKRRSKEQGRLIQMCDALSWNVSKLPEGVEILVANCLAHWETADRGSGAEFSWGMPVRVGEFGRGVSQ